MELESGRSSTLSERHRSMVEAIGLGLPLCHAYLAHAGSAVDQILDRIGGAVQACNRESMAVIQANMGAIHADIENSIEAIHADIGAVQANMIGVHANLYCDIQILCRQKPDKFWER